MLEQVRRPVKSSSGSGSRRRCALLEEVKKKIMRTTSYQTIHPGALYSNSWVHRGVSPTTAGPRQSQLANNRLRKEINNAFVDQRKASTKHGFASVDSGRPMDRNQAIIGRPESEPCGKVIFHGTLTHYTGIVRQLVFENRKLPMEMALLSIVFKVLR